MSDGKKETIEKAPTLTIDPKIDDGKKLAIKVAQLRDLGLATKCKIEKDLPDSRTVYVEAGVLRSCKKIGTPPEFVDEDDPAKADAKKIVDAAKEAADKIVEEAKEAAAKITAEAVVGKD